METVQRLLSRRELMRWVGVASSATILPAWGSTADIPAQPYFANVQRAIDALATLGAPLPPADAERIAALARQNDAAAVQEAEGILERRTLAQLTIESTGTLRIAEGGAKRELVEQGWRVFLVRVANPSARTGSFTLSSSSLMRTGRITPMGASTMARDGSRLAPRGDLADTLFKAPLIKDLWLMTEMYEAAPLVLAGRPVNATPLSGFPVEYRVIQVFSRDAGARRGGLTFYTFGRGAQLAFSPTKDLDFECLPSRVLALSVLDDDGKGCVASFTIKDNAGHVYPLQAMRLAPDMFFHQQIYRGDGETLRLPDGEYRIVTTRGPEYLSAQQTVVVDATRGRVDARLKRWIDPAKWGWYSGDTHIHAAGCSHYQSPTEGVTPETMIRHVRGEGLAIGEVLTWGPSWYYQKQFFTGQAKSPTAALEHPELQAANNAVWQTHATAKDDESLLRYDVEVSGFPSSLSGHLVLLRLKEQDYPGTQVIEDWPSWTLPVLKWAKAQGGVVGFAHCALGMATDSKELPNYEIPPFDSIGTNEAIVDVTHGVTDFLSGCNLQPVAELNAWYHLLNCGFRLAMVGETDYPCVTGERPGVGRTYVQLENRPVDNAGYEAWVRGIEEGRLYCGDGRSHILEFKVGGRRSGEELKRARPGAVTVDALVAARLDAEQTPEAKATQGSLQSWHIENARIGNSREVAVELVVNGAVVDKRTILADGSPQKVRFEPTIERSAWVALRILPSCHSHPVCVLVSDKPVRASKRSAQWCRSAIDKLWEVKSPHMRESERPAAAEAFDHARRTYEKIASECEVE
jgi:hypothetical protein